MSTSKKDQFIYLINQNKGNSLEKIIEQILVSDSIYITSDFLEQKNMRDISNSNNKYYNTLYLFSNKTYTDYIKSKENYIQLTEKMLFKLKVISILELCKTSKLLNYAEIKKLLDIKTNFELETLLFDAISKGLISGKIDSMNEKVYVISIKPRKNLKDIEEAKKMMGKWIDNINETNEYINQQIKTLNEENKKQNEIFGIQG